VAIAWRGLATEVVERLLWTAPTHQVV